MSIKLLVGAGKAEIKYTTDMFPTFDEDYIGIHDLPMIQVLLLECGKRCAIVSVGAVILNIREHMLEIAEEILGIPKESVLLHAVHVLSTPHFKEWVSLGEWQNNPAHNENKTDDTQDELFMLRENMMAQAHLNALEEACRQALSTFRPAMVGAGTGYADVNVNRVVRARNGWLQGTNQEGATDHSISVLRFDDLSGHPIALLYNCNTAPGCLEFSQTGGGGRLVSGDLAAASERFIDNMYDNDVISIYTTGFTGDQWTALRARLDYVDRQGNQVIRDLGSAGFVLVDILAARLGEQVAKAAEKIRASQPNKPIRLESRTFSYPGQDMMLPIGLDVSCESDSVSRKAEIKILQIDDTAIVACGVELCFETYKAICSHSPFNHTFIMEFAALGGGYMPEKVFYDRKTYQARKSPYAKGSAERFREDIISCLHDVFRQQQISRCYSDL